MQVPVSYIHDHLVWDRRGAVWAIFHVPALASVLRTPRDLRKVHAQLRRLLISLPAESALWSTCYETSADGIVERMARSADLDQHPAFAQSLVRVREFLDQYELLKRRYYLSVKLPRQPNLARDVRAVLRAASDVVGRAFGLIPPPRRGHDLRSAVTAAALIEQKLKAAIPVERATAGEICWLYARAPRRGLGEPALDETWQPADGI